MNNAAREVDIILNFLADTSGAQEMQQALNEINGAAHSAAQGANQMSQYYSQGYQQWAHEQSLLSDAARAMQQEMSYGWMTNNQAYIQARENMIAAQYGYYLMARAGTAYNGTTRTMMNQVYALGAAMRSANDQMINNNTHLRMSFLQTAGQMANMTTQAARISDNYDRMRNPLYMLNRGHLAVADTLNRIANNGNAANLALRMLGPTASTKQLNDMVMMINQGLMRFQQVAIGSAITAAVLFYAMHKLSMMNEEYSSSLNTMLWSVYNALQPMLTVFRDIAIAMFNGITAIAQWITAWNDANPILARFIQGVLLIAPALTLLLSPLAIGIGLLGGFQAAWAAIWALIGPLITGLAAMTATVWVVAAALIALYMYFIATGDTADRFREKVDGALSALMSKLQEVFGFAIPYFQTFADAVKNAFGTVSTAIKDAIGGDFEGLKSIFAAILPTLVALLVGGIPGLLISFSRFIPMLGEQLNSQTGMLSGIINNLFTSLVTFLQTGLPQLVQIGAQVIQQLISGIIQYLPALMTGVILIAQNLVQLFGQVLPMLLEAGLTILQSIVEGIIMALPVLLEAALQIIMTIIEMVVVFLPMLLETGTQLLLMLIQGIINMLPMLIDTALTLITTLLNALIALLPQVIQMGVNLLLQLVVGIINALPQLVSAAFTLIIALLDAIVALLPQILAMGVTILKELVGGILSAIGQIVMAAGRIVLDFVNGILDYDYASIGREIINGLVAGISAGGTAVWNAVKGLAGGISNGFKEFFGIASPSKLFKEYGGWLTEGLSIGMVAEVPKAVQASGYVANSVMGEFATESSNGQYQATQASSTVNNSPVVNINIDGQSANAEYPDLENTVMDALDQFFASQQTLFAR